MSILFGFNPRLNPRWPKRQKETKKEPVFVVKEEEAPPETEEKLTIAYWHSKTESVYVFLRNSFFFGLPARIQFLSECSSGTWSSVAHDGMCGSRYNVAR